MICTWGPLEAPSQPDASQRPTQRSTCPLNKARWKLNKASHQMFNLNANNILCSSAPEVPTAQAGASGKPVVEPRILKYNIVVLLPSWSEMLNAWELGLKKQLRPVSYLSRQMPCLHEYSVSSRSCFPSLCQVNFKQ